MYTLLSLLHVHAGHILRSFPLHTHPLSLSLPLTTFNPHCIICSPSIITIIQMNGVTHSLLLCLFGPFSFHFLCLPSSLFHLLLLQTKGRMRDDGNSCKQIMKALAADASNPDDRQNLNRIMDTNRETLEMMQKKQNSLCI